MAARLAVGAEPAVSVHVYEASAVWAADTRSSFRLDHKASISRIANASLTAQRLQRNIGSL